jgi:hypothetical protein
VTRSEHHIKFRADMRQFGREFDKAGKTVEKFRTRVGRALSGLGLRGLGGGLIGGGVGAAVGAASREAREVRDMHKRSGLGIELLQRWGQAAKVTGSNLDELVRILERLAELQENVRRGDTTTEKNFRALGLDPARAANMTPEQLTSAMLKTAKDMEIGALRKLMPELGPRLRRLSGLNFSGHAAAAEVIPADTILEAAQNADKLDLALTRLGITINRKLLPAVNALNALIDKIGGSSFYRATTGAYRGVSDVTSEVPGRLMGYGSTLPGPVGDLLREIISSNKDIERALTEEE